MNTIWRYMDLWKFKSLLQKQALFFSTAELQDDIDEGTYPRLASELRRQMLELDPEIHVCSALKNQAANDLVKKSQVVLSCWHINTAENPAMWGEYVKEPPGIVIKSSRAALERSFEPFSHAHLIDIRTVRYINPDNDRESLIRPLDVYFQKLEKFQWENELRCAIDMAQRPLKHHRGGEWKPDYQFGKEGQPVVLGVFVPINVQTLIDSIVVSPEASDSVVKQVKAMCLEFGLTKPVMLSGAAA